LFLQDAWTMGQRLTVNVGLRTERETVPRYAEAGQDATPIIEFGFGQKLAPRVGRRTTCGATDAGRSTAAGASSTTPSNTACPPPSGPGRRGYSFTLDTYNWPLLLANAACPPACPAHESSALHLGQHVHRRGRSRPGAHAACRRPSWRRAPAAASAAGRGALRSQAAGSRRRGHRLARRVLQRDLHVGNPGYHRATIAYPGVALPKAVRDYDGVELAARRPLTNHWAFHVSYLWSRLDGNFSGLSQSTRTAVWTQRQPSLRLPGYAVRSGRAARVRPLATTAAPAQAQLIYETGFA